MKTESLLLLPPKSSKNKNFTPVDASHRYYTSAHSSLSRTAGIQFHISGIMKATESPCLSKSSFHSTQSLDNCIIYIRLRTHTSRHVNMCVCGKECKNDTYTHIFDTGPNVTQKSHTTDNQSTVYSFRNIKP